MKNKKQIKMEVVQNIPPPPRNKTLYQWAFQLIVAITLSNNLYAQTDTVWNVSDTSIITTTDFIIADSTGEATLFAGGEESDYKGKVGIGTSEPQEKLDVVGDNSFISWRTPSASSTVTTGSSCCPISTYDHTMRLGMVGTSSYPSVPASLGDLLLELETKCPSGANMLLANNSFGGSMRFYTRSSCGGYPLERMRISAIGYVGIGTNTPTQRFHVKNGNALFECNTRILNANLEVNTSLPYGISSGGVTIPAGTPLTGFYAGNTSLYAPIKVGIGTVNPAAFLTIRQGDLQNAIQIENTSWTNTPVTFKVSTTGITSIGAIAGPQEAYLNVNTFEPNYKAFAINVIKSDGTQKENFMVSNTGALHAAELHVNGTDISGTIIENFKVTADGKVRAREIKVTMANPFPDYVFEPEYKLMPLTELQQFITKNKHLPQMPTASEVTEHGMDVGELNRILTQKVEELTLYILALENRLTVIEQKGGK